MAVVSQDRFYCSVTSQYSETCLERPLFSEMPCLKRPVFRYKYTYFHTNDLSVETTCLKRALFSGQGARGFSRQVLLYGQPSPSTNVTVTNHNYPININRSSIKESPSLSINTVSKHQTTLSPFSYTQFAGLG